MGLRRGAWLLCALLATPAGAADAPPWQASAADGALRFTPTLAGGRFEGRFREFDVRLWIEDGAPARLAVEVRVASADTAEAERDAVLRGPLFFASERHPAARYRAGRFRTAGDGWLADGELTLRGNTRALPLRFTLRRDGDGWRLQGGTTIARLAWGVGQGEWASTEWLADAVGVAFDLRLRPGGAASP